MFQRFAVLSALSILVLPGVLAKTPVAITDVKIKASAIMMPLEAAPDSQQISRQEKIPSTRQDYLDIIEKSRKILAKNPTAAGAYIDLGYAHRELGLYRQDIDFCSHAIRLDPRIPVAYSERAMAYCAIGEDHKALSDLQRAIKLDPNNSSFYSIRGWIYVKQGEFARAVDECSRSIGIYAGYSPAYYCRGRAYFSLGNYRQAVADYSEAIKLFPDGAASYYFERAMAYDLLSDRQRADADMKTGIKMEPENYEGYYLKGVMALHRKTLEEAVKCFNKALQYNADSIEVWRMLSQAHMEMGRLDAALGDIGRAIKLDVKDSYSYVLQGEVFLRLLNFRQACQTFNKAVLLNPKEADALVGRAEAHLQAGAYKAAVADCNRAIAISVDHRRAYMVRAQAYGKLGDLVREKEDRQKASQDAGLAADKLHGLRIPSQGLR